MSPERIRILLVDDDPADVELTREALRDAKVLIRMDVASDGEEALQYLAGNKPSLILLDLNLPKKDGREVLAEIKKNPELMRIPVIVLTTSDQDVDVCKSYGLGANAYVTKPVGFEDFRSVVRHIEDFWFTIVKLPSR
ncbi:MAG: response regulator [Candidatus Omnitrophica bacterium]|nr:response regulator [Candidatus Omnitrophota bacterium]